MKKIDFNTQSAQDDYLGVFRSIISNAPADGYSIGQVAAAVNILKKAEAVTDGFLSLEDAEYEFAMGRIGQHKWGIAHANVLDFMDRLTSAKGE